MPEFWTKHFDQEYPLHLPPQNILKTFKNSPFRQPLCHVHSCDRNVFWFRPHQLNQTTIEVDRLSSVSEIVVWLRETNMNKQAQEWTNGKRRHVRTRTSAGMYKRGQTQALTNKYKRRRARTSGDRRG